MIAARDASPAARDMATEDVLEQCDDAAAIDLTDETSYDSAEFPKVVFDQVAPDDTDDRCAAAL
jgi:hypothetical protein